MDRSLQFPGVSNAWTMPIKARIDMLSTGIRTPVGVKVIGKDLAEMEKVARQVETALKTVPGTASAYAERVVGGYYLEVIPDRDRLARYGLMIADVQNVVASALGAEPITTTVEGRERYTVAIRYPRDLRSDPQSIAKDVLVSLPGGGTVPLGEVADIRLTQGATSIRTENAKLATYIFVDIRDRDLGGYVADAKKAVEEQVKLPPGTYLVWSGQFEYLERAEARLKLVVPVTLMIIFLLLYLNFRRITETLIVMLSLPFAPRRRNVADVVARVQHVGGGRGRLHRAGRRRRRDRRGHADLPRPRGRGDPRRAAATRARLSRRADLYEAIMIGAVERVRPKMMTVVAIMAGLLPIMWSTGTGSEVMQRIAVPMIGGMVSSTLLTLIVIPAVYGLIKGWQLPTATAPTDLHREALEPV